MRKFDYTVMIIDTHHRLLLIPEYKIWDLRHNSDHFTIMLCLSIEMEKGTLAITWEKIQFPLWPPNRVEMQGDTLFYDFSEATPKLSARAARYNAWISEETWTLVVMNGELHHEPKKDQNEIILLGHQT